MAAVSAAQIGSFIEIMAPLAMEQMKKHGGRLYASVCIAQAAHETGWGTSKTMMGYNAPFGIKVGNSAYHFGSAWKGASYNTKTKEYYGGSSSPTVIRDNFRAYSSLSDATEDYMDMLCTASRYRGALGCSTPEESIKAIVAAGYATGPSYAGKIIEIINSKTYNLKRYDMGKIYKDVSPDIIKRVILGEFGTGTIRQQALEKEGYRYADVRAKINELYKLSQESKKSLEKRCGEYLECAIMLMML